MGNNKSALASGEYVLRAPNHSVSPIIKTLRWSALLYGIYYGRIRWKQLTLFEKEFQEKQMDRVHFNRDRAELRKLIRDEDELNQLASDVGVPARVQLDRQERRLIDYSIEEEE